MGRILIVDDEPHMRRVLASALALDRHVTLEASGVTEAKAQLGAEDFDAVFTDQKMGDGEGLDVLAAVRELDPALSVVFITAFNRRTGVDPRRDWHGKGTGRAGHPQRQP
jgi:DNA-binding NtrC family response regulator